MRDFGFLVMQAGDKAGELQGDPVGEIRIWRFNGEIRRRGRNHPEAEEVNKFIRREG